ncbi:amidohydrolase family protein [Methylobacterium sp. PvR107]|uniref:amidohydrolase family protein n=1 Tax=Methylobacterium sp. PvR107 TaxID=2806597 RepID=UPI001AE2E256|nr:amidohydrolase family protein [Methylobacterium sp. PvR107]MBP1178882.1 putative TIM-barrel fold metal-dependent hydrolase [Methylobacterium sp. PvR107]
MITLDPSRRRVLGGAAAATLGASLGLRDRPASAQHTVRYSTGSAAPTFKVPPNTADCHFHIYDNRVPPAAGGLPAPDATPDDYRALQARLGTTRGVVVQPSLYGTDNRPTLAGMAALGPNFRGVAVVTPAVSDAELRRLHDLGIRGVRFNLAQAGTTTLDMLEPLSQRVDALGWHCQINMPGDKIVAASDTFLKIRGKLVFDHLAHCPQPAGVQSDTFKLMRRLLDQGNTWVKLTGHYADTTVGPPSYADTVAVARAFAAAAPTRCVWGTDWPHPTERQDNKPDDALLLDLFPTFVPNEADRTRILVDNPAELYDFPKA